MLLKIITIFTLIHSYQFLTFPDLQYLLNNKFNLNQALVANCTENSEQLAKLLTYMCQKIDQMEAIFDAAACIQCFRSGSFVDNNQPSFNQLRNCASNYLIGTRYENCATIINAAVVQQNGKCLGGYCSFVSCIRRINSDLLIAQCYNEASSNNDAIFENDQVILVKNITSCILARVRCSPTNPITGQQQTNHIINNIYNKWGKITNTIFVPLYNFLQITPSGDLRVIALPGTTKIQNYFCTSQPNLQESSWLDYTC